MENLLWGLLRVIKYSWFDPRSTPWEFPSWNTVFSLAESYPTTSQEVIFDDLVEKLFKFNLKLFFGQIVSPGEGAVKYYWQI